MVPYQHAGSLPYDHGYIMKKMWAYMYTLKMNSTVKATTLTLKEIWNIELNPQQIQLVFRIIQGFFLESITSGRVLDEERLYTEILEVIIYLHLPTDCFMKISFQSEEPRGLERNLHETVCRQMQIN